jgi:spore germination protein GerM
MRRWAAAALAAATLAGLSGLPACGVSTDSEPHEISRSNVPEGFSGESGAPHQGTGGQGGEEASVWFLQDEEGTVTLIPRRRTVPRPKTATGVLEALLLDGPSESERAFNITTAIPSSTTLASPPELERGVLIVDLSQGLFEVRGDDLRNAYAELVCTATGIGDTRGIDGVRAVRFELDGEAISAFDGNGQDTDRALRCSDYAGLLPSDRSTTTTRR